ncbi:SPOR domain-containing protein, partial [Teichococcus deserti]|uniref:SPOR domain-containing protein n=1 Tax=Teichococcus deserti TaxID=1817963 RepID=UPI001056A17D
APAPTSQRIATAFAAPAAPTPSSGLRGFSLVGTAHAATVAPPANVLRLPSRDAAPAPAPTPVATAAANGAWGVQVGAFASANLARTAAGEARSRLGISSARPAIEQVSSGSGTLYRARVMGLSREHAQSACDKLRSQGACIIVSPGAQG